MGDDLRAGPILTPKRGLELKPCLMFQEGKSREKNETRNRTTLKDIQLDKPRPHILLGPNRFDSVQLEHFLTFCFLSAQALLLILKSVAKET